MMRKWRDARKKSPKKTGSYLAACPGITTPVIRQFENGAWRSTEEVHYWMPAPKLPKRRLIVLETNERAIARMSTLTDEDFSQVNRALLAYITRGTYPELLSAPAEALFDDIVKGWNYARDLPEETTAIRDASFFASITHMYAMKVKEKAPTLWETYKTKMFP